MFNIDFEKYSCIKLYLIRRWERELLYVELLIIDSVTITNNERGRVVSPNGFGHAPPFSLDDTCKLL